MAAVVASSRMVSATVLLTLIVTGGGCLAMASAVPVANARRLQQQIPGNVAGGVLAAGQQEQLQPQEFLQHLIIQVQDLLAGITGQAAQPLPLLSRSALGIRTLDQASLQLQAHASTLRHQLQDPSNSGLRTRNALQAVVFALDQLQAAVFDVQNVPAAVQGQLQSLGVSTGNLANALRGLLPVAGLPSNGQKP